MRKQYTFKAYPAGMSRSVYRVIQMPGDETLDSLCGVIIESFGFIDEHLYEFCMDNRMYSDYSYQSDPEYDEPSTNVKLDELCLAKGQNFSLHYDFGDDWMFTIHVQKIERSTQPVGPMIVKALGKIEQYSMCDDWDDEDDWDDA